MVDEKSIGTKNQIWLTSKSRMHAERRLRLYDRISHISLSWLSLSVIASATVRGFIAAPASLDIMTAILSVIVFAFSVIVFGFRFGETAAQHRECYLRLQKLHDSELGDSELSRQYHEILGGYGNHSDWDYESLVLNRTFYTDRKLWGRDEKEITWSVPMLLKHIALSVLFWLLAGLILILGFVPFYVVATQLP